MKKYFIALAAFLLFCTISGNAQINFNNQVLVYFKTGAQRVAPANTATNITSVNILNVLSNYSIPVSNVVPSFPAFIESDTVKAKVGESSRQMNRAKVFTITITNPNTKAAFINSLNALSEVLYAESNGYVSKNIIPIDGWFGQQWGMRNTIVPGADIHLDGATNIFAGNPNSIIAIIDNGVDRVHDDLDAKILGGDNGFEILTDPLVGDFSHGSHVAGIAAAISNNNNNNGVAGVDWQARIHPKNIFDGNGDPDITTSIIDAVNFNANVWTFNNSWGTRNADGSPNRYSVTIRSAFAQAYRNNRVSCIAMGNHQEVFPDVPAFPASINSGVIAVGATDIFDNITEFSARGPHIDVAAPGNAIISTNFNNNYVELSGTSMATPHVAGLASLLKGFNPALANDDIEQIIRLSADDRGAAGFDNAFGTGRINAERALQFLQAPNTVQHLSATGGTVFSTSGNMTRVFLGVPGLADAAYIVRRSEVRRNITFPPMCNIIGVWGRGVGTTGFREENGRNFGEGICEIVPGTLTNTSATLRTWIYEVWTANGQNIGFRPVIPANVVFQYTIVGVPAPLPINGDDNICTTSNNYSIPDLISGATVTWSVKPNGIVIINSPNSNQTTLTRTGNGTITLTATISNACGTLPFILTKTIHVGLPYITQNAGSGSYTPYPDDLEPGEEPPVNQICTGQQISMTVNVERASHVSWTRTSANPSNTTWSQSGNTLSFYLWGDNQQATFQASASNGCGIAQESFSFKSIKCGGDPGDPDPCNQFAVSPNPAKSNINIYVPNIPPPCDDPPIIISKTGKSKIERGITQLRLFDNSGNLKKQQSTAKTKQTSLNISGLTPGIYYLEISDGSYKERQKIVIQ